MPSVTASFPPVGHDRPLSSGLTREICKVCLKPSPVSFAVPDDIWMAVVPPQFHDKVLCLSCFIALADEKLIP